MMIRTIPFALLAFIFGALPPTSFAQPNKTPPPLTRTDTLRGALSPERTCYDVRWYHLDVTIDPSQKRIDGSTTIRFTGVHESQRLQVDLFANMNLNAITLDGGAPLAYTREYGAVFITLPRPLTPGESHDLIVEYGGEPRVAPRAPWEGGFIWTKDTVGNPWVAVACQGTGASLWWPNKDHQADEPDSMLISVTVPPGLEDVSNGRLRSVTKLPGGWTRYDWGVTYPINNYDVTVNVGKFAHFADVFYGADTLTLDYYVHPEHLQEAQRQFQQVKTMLACFERDFGPYPFPRDGYKLVQSPHLGMEHQTAVAYGNGFHNGYRRTSSSRYGLMFDFIIVHESAHEWWGNSVTSKDIADMWIHESFGAHAEALFVECNWGYDAMLDYVNSKKGQVGNLRPIIGLYGVNKEGSGDMYPKGSLMLHTFRGVLDNDSLWFGVIKGIAQTFRYQTITTEDIVRYVNTATGRDYTYFFNQYLRYASLPRLEVNLASKGSALSARYRWRADVTDFRMPIKVTTAPGKYSFISPTTAWQTLDLGTMNPNDFRVAEQLFYIDAQIRVNYQESD
jgi:aminopeptidase N